MNAEYVEQCESNQSEWSPSSLFPSSLFSLNEYGVTVTSVQEDLGGGTIHLHPPFIVGKLMGSMKLASRVRQSSHPCIWW